MERVCLMKHIGEKSFPRISIFVMFLFAEFNLIFERKFEDWLQNPSNFAFFSNVETFLMNQYSTV